MKTRVYLRELSGNHEIWICDKTTETLEFVWIKTRGDKTFYLEALQPGATARNQGFMSPISPEEQDKFIGENDIFVDHCEDNSPTKREWKKSQVLAGNWFKLDAERTRSEELAREDDDAPREQRTPGPREEDKEE